jgi:1,4-dihydroxy-2-naphthoyl-CoA hydrolase
MTGGANMKDMNSHTMMEVMGIENVRLEKDCVVMKMPVHDATKQPFGLLHGGASVALAESAASIGTWLNIDQERQAAVGIEINANHLRSKRDGHVIATATPVHKGRTTMVWDIRICDENDKLVCISRCTVAVIDRPRHE